MGVLHAVVERHAVGGVHARGGGARDGRVGVFRVAVGGLARSSSRTRGGRGVRAVQIGAVGLGGRGHGLVLLHGVSIS